MLKNQAELRNLSLDKGIRGRADQIPTNRFRLISYKTGLIFHDLLLLFGLASLCCPSEAASDHLVLNLLIAFAILFYLNIMKLYSYHLIYSVREHLVALSKTFLYSLLTIGTIIALATVPKTIVNTYLFPLLLVSTVGFICLNRVSEVDLTWFLAVVGVSFIITGVFESWSSYFLYDGQISWVPAFRMLLTTVGVFTISRIILVHQVYGRVLRRKFRRQVLVVGNNTEANEFARHIFDLNAPFWIAGTVDYKGESSCHLTAVDNKDCLGALHQLPELVSKHKISEIVVTGKGVSKHQLIGILDFCTSAGINAWFVPGLMPIIDIKLYIDRFCGRPMIRLCSQKHSWFFYKIKNIFDALITLPVFVLQLPLFLILIASVKLDSKGPAFYKARAIGKGGRPFDMYKFRSMFVDSKQTVHQEFVTKLIKGDISQDKKKNGPLKIVNDPRVTRVGRILRKISLDELPQLINVLKGQMSLVGPRPCLSYEYDIYQDWHKKRTVVRPGITGLWQVTGRSEVLFEDMILLDLYYVYNSSLVLDFQILVETVFVVLGKRGGF